MSKFEDVTREVIEWIDEGAYGMTDFVHKTAQAHKCNKADVRAIINHYDQNPGSPAGRPAAIEEPIVVEGSVDE